MHIGLGAFARAHLAVYTDEVLARGHFDWGICGVSMRSAAVRDALEPQAGLYTVVELGSDTPRVIGSVIRCLVEPEDPQRVRRALLDPAIRIATLTVTEAAYAPESPTIRLLVDALAMRFEAGHEPFAVLCLDNISGTGSAVRELVVEAARAVDESLAVSIADTVAFPRAIGDRMVPRTTDADRRMVRRNTGVKDAWPVVAEPYRQWVLEDDFPAGRPPWEETGATFVHDVGPWEGVKFQMLNAGHFTLACLGMLAGYERVSDAAQDSSLRQHLERLLLDEIARAIRRPEGFDLASYVATTIRRFGNPDLGYTAARTVSGGSLKLRARVIPSVVALAGRGADRLALTIAAWIRIMVGPLSALVTDPCLERIKTAASVGPPDARSIAFRVLTTSGLFEELRPLGNFSDRVCRLSSEIADNGVRAALDGVDP